MQELRLVAVNESGTHLVLTGPDGRDYLLRLDERLQAAIRRDLARLGQLEIEMEPQLRPREIQSRIRAGESVADVAAAAQVPMVRIERFAGPVLAERAHVADAARRAAVRRRSDGPDAPLGELVEQRLAVRGVEVTDVSWDAFRREDSRWMVRLDYLAAGTARTATWVYDPAVRVATCDDDEARWLTDDRSLPPAEPASAGRGTVPRLVGLPRPGGGEAASGGARPEPAVAAEEEVAVAAGDGAEAAAAAARAAHPALASRGERRTAASDRHALTSSAKPGKRATVPSWDDIVFGRRRPASDS